MSAIQVLVDPPQTRILNDALRTTVSGRDWDPTTWGSNYGTWVDPITNTLMLEPAPLNVGWTQQTSSPFFKYGIPDFQLTDSGNWQPNNVDQGGPFYQYLGPQGNQNGLTGLGPTQVANQAMCIELFAPTNTPNAYGLLSFGWSQTGDGTQGVSVRVYYDGKTEIWKDGVLRGTGSVAGKSVDYYDPQTGAIGQAPQNQYWTILAIPCRDRELLLYSFMGGGFSYVFDDIPEGQSGQTITDAAPFWFFFPTGVAATIRVAKIQYAASGTACGVVSGWRFAPPSGNPNTVLFQSLSQQSLGASCQAIAAQTNYYSLPYPVQLQVSLFGGPSQTPFIYGASAYYPTQTAQTGTSGNNTGGVDATTFTTALSIDISDTFGGGHATLSLNQPAALAAVGIPQITTQCARPFQINDSVGTVLTAISDSPHWIDASQQFGDVAYDIEQIVEFKLRDKIKLLEQFVFEDPIPLDGQTLAAAFQIVGQTAGFKVKVSHSANNFYLPSAGVSAAGDWNLCVEVGDKGVEAIDRLHKNFAANWFLDIDQDGDIVITDPADMSTASVVTLYRSQAEAIAAGVSPEMAPYRVYRKFEQTVLEPEAVAIWVEGIDPRSGRPIIAYYIDPVASNPQVSPADRPANWVGWPKAYAWTDPSLTTMDVCQYALSLLKQRLTVPRAVVEFESEYLDGIWRGQCVTLHGANIASATSPGLVRLKTVSAQIQIVNEIAQWRPARYTAEAGPLVCPLGVYGTRLRQIRENWTLKTVIKAQQYADSIIAGRRPPLNIQPAA